jgi:hypothetical protein
MKVSAVASLLCAKAATTVAATEFREISESELRSKIDGWWIGQLVGNFMGLPFEFVYYNEPMPIEPQVRFPCPFLSFAGERDCVVSFFQPVSCSAVSLSLSLSTHVLCRLL